MNNLIIDESFWKNKRVFITGHTGFKGSWLCLWLDAMGAKVTGFALEPPTNPSLFEIANIAESINDIRGDVRDFKALNNAMSEAAPEVVFHLAAQPLVRESYRFPIETYEINVMGTVHVLEAIHQCGGVRACVNVTTDKCYENQEWYWGYRENDPMGGYDPYSNSKGCSELVTSAFRNSYFNPRKYGQHGVALASARAGNVIGGGDWACDRLIPDCIRALTDGIAVQIRSPHSIRPWQHVLEPLAGYLLLAQKLFQHGTEFAEGWNFGPRDEEAKEVQWIVKSLCQKWGQGSTYTINTDNQLHEANYLKLDISKATQKLGWYPVWNLDRTLQNIVDWYIPWVDGSVDMKQVCLNQIRAYLKDTNKLNDLL